MQVSASKVVNPDLQGGSPAAAHVDGWAINLATPRDAILKITEAARAGDCFSTFTLNLDHLVKLRTDATFRRAYPSARFVTADGGPVARIAKRQWPAVERTTGSDLFIPLCEAAADQGIPVYFFGTSTHVLEQTVEHLLQRTGHRLKVAGFEAPPAGFDPGSEAAQQCLDRIASSGARLCFVMLGAPKQEVLAARAVEQGIACGFVCVGAAADFIVGHQVRAPLALQKIGLEWLWRMGQNPRRLAMRYARCAMLLARIELNQMFTVRSPAS